MLESKYFYGYLKNDSYDKEINNEPDPKKRIVAKVDLTLESMGLWYTLLAKIILPFILYIIPFNVIISTTNEFIIAHFLPEWRYRGTPMLLMWIIALTIFLVLIFFAPKIATVVEYISGSIYLYFAVKHLLFHGALGYIVFIQIVLFLLCKTFFLVIEILRIVNNKNNDNSENNNQKPYDDYLFTKSDDSTEENLIVVDDSFYYDENKKVEEDIIHPGLADEQVVFSKENEENDANIPSDNDYII